MDRDGEFVVSWRELPRMALIQPQLHHFDLVVRAPGMRPLHLQIDTVEAACTARVWNDEVRAFDMGGSGGANGSAPPRARRHRPGPTSVR